jgi:cyclopropane fatty-acyl-phospholipid synthase-like methyltransferase
VKPLRYTLAALLWTLCAAASAQQMHEHRFSDAERWAKIFDDPARDAWQRPQEVIAALAVAPDSTVADIGSGTGYFAVRLARAAPKGRVYGVDTEPSMVKYLDERAKHEGLANLVSIAGRPGDATLPGKVDLVLMVDVYHHIGERESYFGRLRGSLNPGARVAIIDFRLDAASGPPKRERITPAQVKTELEKSGYALAKEHEFLPNQYFLVFEAKP